MSESRISGCHQPLYVRDYHKPLGFPPRPRPGDMCIGGHAGCAFSQACLTVWWLGDTSITWKSGSSGRFFGENTGENPVAPAYVPRTQMTLVLIEKGLVLEGWPSKIEVSWLLGIYVHLEFYNNVAFEMRFVNFDSLGFPSKILEKLEPWKFRGIEKCYCWNGKAITR